MSNKEKFIALVVGHRESKQGAYGNAGVSEYEYNSALANDVKIRIEASGLKCGIFYRDDSTGIGYKERMRRLHKTLDAAGVTHSVEMHFNDYANPRVSGNEVLYYSKKGKRSASILSRQFNKRLQGSKNRGIKRRYQRTQNGYWFLKKGYSVCVIAEPFFASHQKEFMDASKGYYSKREGLIDAYVSWANKV